MPVCFILEILFKSRYNTKVLSMTSWHLSTRRLVWDLSNLELNLTELSSKIIGQHPVVYSKSYTNCTKTGGTTRKKRYKSNLHAIILYFIICIFFEWMSTPPFIRAKCRYVISTWRDLWNNNDDVIMGTKIWKKYCVHFCLIFMKRQ